MKLKITKAEFDKLPDVLKAVYKADEKDPESYVLQVEGLEDTGALKRAKEHEKTERQRLEKELEELKKSKQSTEEEAMRKQGDVKALEESWAKKLKAREDELTGHNKTMEKQLHKVLVDNVALDLATKISKSPTVILPHIKSRLAVEFDKDSGEYKTRVLDVHGKPSASSLDDLQKEFVANKDFSAIVISSKATGGGAGSASAGSGGTGALDYTKASSKEIAADLKARGLADSTG